MKIQGIALPQIGQGCMGIGGRFSRNTSHDSEEIDALKLGIDLGMTFIDTAEVYGDGHSEEIVGRAVKGNRQKVFLASKVSPHHLSPGNLKMACDSSLARLGTDYLDLYQIHWPNPSVPLEDTIEAMVRLIEQGKILHIGVSNFSVSQIKTVQRLLCDIPLFSVQSEYNLFERLPEQSIIPFCTKNNILFIAYSPLDQGHVVRSALIRDGLRQLGTKLSQTPAQIALNFLASMGPVLPIPKALKKKHIQENATACYFRLPSDVYDDICKNYHVPVIEVPWEQIRPIVDCNTEKAAYSSIEQALANPARHAPSPLELAEEMRKCDTIKPIRVTRINQCNSDDFLYDLEEGRLKFWAWIIAFEGRRKVPVMIRD